MSAWKQGEPTKPGKYLLALENTIRNERWVKPVEIKDGYFLELEQYDGMQPVCCFGRHITIHGWMPYPKFPRL